MADIFLSYARKDLTKVEWLASALVNSGWSVFWDRTSLLAGQDFEQEIESAIQACGCMIVIWSEAAKKSDWVRGEAEMGRELKKLVPICLDADKPPLSFRALHTESFASWNGDADSEEFRKLQSALHRLVVKGDESPNANKMSVPPEFPNPVRFAPKVTMEPGQNPIQPEMIVIPSGAFQMGDIDCADEHPIHTVTFKRSFALGKYPVTFAEYDCFAIATGRSKLADAGWGRGRRPVINVNWEDAYRYAQWLAGETGKAFRLPSEAEWEYAVRAGTKGSYYWSDGRMAAEYAWYCDNSKGMTHPVGEKKPNAFGLYDMVGNVWEWLLDDWHKSYWNAPYDGTPWREIWPSDSSGLILRGGSWGSGLSGLRSAARRRGGFGDRASNIGFRLALDLTE